MNSSSLQMIEIAPEIDDTALLLVTRTAMRQGDGALQFRGALEKAPADETAFVSWINLIADARQFLCLSGTGAIGPYGLALALACDVVVLSPDASCGPDWRSTPGLIALAGRRLGSLGMRSLFLGERDPVQRLAELGQVTFDAAPETAVNERLAALGGPKAAAALRRTMRAFEELPYAEASDFEAWAHKLQQGIPA